ncbi:MAG: CoB--CoM heterodisulfide reductase iron-sulfur subunit B family protein [Desulfohalobiaceae bacterium]
MKYAYYPGCSLSESAREYDVATRKVLSALDVETLEIPDWTCCGASAVESISKLLTYSLPARNLSLAQRELPGLDVLVPCSACYLNLLRVNEESVRDRELSEKIGQVLEVEGLSYDGGVTVRHLLDVLVNDVGEEAVGGAVSRKLQGLRVAPYYGCQILRPYARFDDPERPVSMEPLITRTGAEVHTWNMGGKCCGASLMTTKKEVAMHSVSRILGAARGADVIVTVCPMCQMNLEAFQKQAMRGLEQHDPISVLYLPQLLGLSMGLRPDDLLLHKNMVVTDAFTHKLDHPVTEEA